MLAAAIEKNQLRERATATSDGTPVDPRKRTKANSLTPMPDIDMGINEITIIKGTKIKRGNKGTLKDIPVDRMKIESIPEICTINEYIRPFIITSLLALYISRYS